MAKKPVNDAEKLKRTHLTAKTEKQREYLIALKEADQVFAIGPAGSGKTYIPIMFALQKYLKREINKIILTRPAVEVGESHGYLPGDLNRKLAPWVIPITEIMEEVLGKERFLQMMRDGDFEVAPFAYMRGRTFNNAFVMLDEAQNTTVKQMEMFLTRIGEDTKMVICGDLRQSDVCSRSGLSRALELIKAHNLPARIVEFTSKDVVRSSICQQWVEAFEKGA
jgi:phosphate starvation-inducible protein PhoH and related proteins